MHILGYLFINFRDSYYLAFSWQHVNISSSYDLALIQWQTIIWAKIWPSLLIYMHDYASVS